VSKWISVGYKAKRPKHDEEVIVMTVSGKVTAAMYFKDPGQAGYFYHYSPGLVADITHWMPMPAPPGGEE
jgi:hypothetical protein